MLIIILKKSILALHKDATMILLYQFLGELKTIWRAIYEVNGGLKQRGSDLLFAILPNDQFHNI